MLKKIFAILSNVIILGLAVIAGLLIIPNIMGFKSMAVLSGSMEPKIGVGAIVYVKETDPDLLEIGDVITFQVSADTMVTHRIADIDPENQQVITKGDANDAADGNPVSFTSIIGKEVFHVPYLGFLSIYIKTPLGIAGVCGILIVLIILNFLPDILQGEEKKKDEEETKEEN